MDSTEHSAKLFLCPQCGKSLTRHGHLLRHLRIHEGQKPFLCDSCGSAFGRRGGLGSWGYWQAQNDS
ncbi:hypothetical protein M427DRAFT_159559 [Gonapodya prolifera JEL478]|uniref:C2H2-type domain-containing protein n=1 Tax=Gonapodya prolifera (strain JEL478) TaxID=1344416 RepID=A0A139A0J3_GONPJ|nr:hypothetical protein M427DRAFT_159559 [Gonapodya prolifera JEL478]|eukprot:KXS10306.1 hypothetical protein M427DRAFT_159559 [Gonapodya prolifera JEL478]